MSSVFSGRFTARHFEQTFKKWQVIARKDAETGLRIQAKGLVVELFKVTPPAGNGVEGSAAKARGEQAIVDNISKLMVGVTVQGKRGKSRLDDRTSLNAEALYLQFRNAQSKSGRVNVRNLSHPYYLPANEVTALLKRLLALVGTLASGWVPAAMKYGAKVPSFVKRQSGSHGSVREISSPRRFIIRFMNGIRFADDVYGLERRVEWAVKRQTSKMQNQINAILTKAGKKAGFK